MAAKMNRFIDFMFDLKERPYPGHELKSFWCDSDIKTLTGIRKITLKLAAQSVKPSVNLGEHMSPH